MRAKTTDKEPCAAVARASMSELTILAKTDASIVMQNKSTEMEKRK